MLSLMIVRHPVAVVATVVGMALVDTVAAETGVVETATAKARQRG